MIRFATRRVLLLVPLLLLLGLVTFLLVEAAPGDPALLVAGEDADVETVERIREQLGLDDPPAVRYVEYVGSAARGDLGESLVTGQPVADAIAPRLQRTALIAAFALVLSAVIGVPLGCIAALRRNGLIDRLVTGSAVVFMAIPSYVVAIVLIWALALGSATWFQASGYVPLSDGLGQWLRYATLPAIALAGIPAAELTRQVRGSMIDQLEEDYVRTARSKGLPAWLVVAKHAARNAAVPVITVFGLVASRILGSTVLVEQIFNIPGLGRLGVEAVLTRDISMIQGVVLVSGVIVLVTNALVDLTYGFLNPRLRT